MPETLNSEGTGTESHIPRPYTISVAEFQQSPTHIAAYTEIGKPIDRNSFIQAVIYSYAFSRKNLDIQRTFFAWMDAHTGLDYVGTFRNFHEAGGINSLTAEETDAFITAYERVRGHESMSQQIQEQLAWQNEQEGASTTLRDEVLSELQGDTRKLMESSQEVAKVLLSQEELSSLSWPEFKQKMNAYYEELKDTKTRAGKKE